MDEQENLIWVIRCKHGQFIRKWPTFENGMCYSFEDAQKFTMQEGAEEFLWRFKQAMSAMPFDRTWFVEGWALDA